MTRIIVITQADIDNLPAQYRTPEVLAFIETLFNNDTLLEALCGIEVVRGKSLTPPAVPVAATTPAVPATGLLPKPAILCAPEKGEECPVPWGMDIRALGWNGHDWTFVACPEWFNSLSHDGKTITAAPEWTRGGIRYVCAGHREPKSGGPLVENLSGQYQETMRWYYWPTRESVK